MEPFKNNHGQALLEFSWAAGLLLPPLLLGGGYWFQLEMNRSICAYQGFFKARNQLIHENRKITKEVQCKDIHESVTLLPLESLDLNQGGLAPTDVIKEATRLWGDVSRLLPSSQESGSSESWDESTI